jgi:DNA-binding transcriptional MerR regulator
MTRTLTVSEIAGMLDDAPERQGTLIERIRHWTREGLIQPIGEKNPGTGRHREYEADVVIDVAVLNLLANLGLQLSQQREVLKPVREFYVLNKQNPTFEKYEHYLAIANPDGKTPQLVVHAGYFEPPLLFRSINPKISFPTSDAYLVINIGRIYKNATEKLKAAPSEKGTKSQT